MTAPLVGPSCPMKTSSISSNLQLLSAMGSFFMRTTVASCKSPWSCFHLVAGIFSTNSNALLLTRLPSCYMQELQPSGPGRKVSRQISKHMLVPLPIRCKRVTTPACLNPTLVQWPRVRLSKRYLPCNQHWPSGLHLPCPFSGPQHHAVLATISWVSFLQEQLGFGLLWSRMGTFILAMMWPPTAQRGICPSSKSITFL